MKNYKQGSELVTLMPLKVNPRHNREIGVKEVEN